MKPRISVVMATHEGERYLNEQIQSILNQTQLPDELIIYDDCSQDQTYAIIKQLQLQDELPIQVFRQDHHVGYIRNFASGLRMANGDVIFLCDQDDVWEPNKIQSIMAQFENHPDVTCINTNATLIDQSGTCIEQNQSSVCWAKLQPRQAALIPFEEILYHNISMGCTMAFHKEVKELYLKKSNFHSTHDWELNMIAALNGKLLYVHEPLIRYRIHEHNTTGNDRYNAKNHIFAGEREKNAHSLLSYISACLQYTAYMNETQETLVNDLQEFHEKRLELLQEGRKRNWWYLITHKQIYRKLVSGKGMLVDLFYAGKK